MAMWNNQRVISIGDLSVASCSNLPLFITRTESQEPFDLKPAGFDSEFWGDTMGGAPVS